MIGSVCANIFFVPVTHAAVKTVSIMYCGAVQMESWRVRYESAAKIIFTSEDFHLGMYVLKQSLKGGTSTLRHTFSSNTRIVYEFTDM